MKLGKLLFFGSTVVLGGVAWAMERLRGHEHFHPVEVPTSIVHRNLLYDSRVENTELVATELGLSPISEDVAEMEREAAERRLRRISSLVPLMEEFSAVLAHAAVAQQVRMLGDDISPEVTHAMFAATFVCARAAQTSGLAEMVDLGLVAVREMP